jgi:hypothetical protein
LRGWQRPQCLHQANRLHRLFGAGHLVEDNTKADVGPLLTYGIAFDRIKPAASDDQAEEYYRYLLSSGTRRDEFRFFVTAGSVCHGIEYWLFDSADSAFPVRRQLRLCEDLRSLQRLCRKPVRRHIFSNAAADAVRCIMRRM